MKIALLVLFFPLPLLAWDSAKCSKMLNDGLYKTYKWGGVGDYNLNAMTQETKKSGSATGSTKITAEGTTAIVDPKYSTNSSSSASQSTSSWGDCSLFAMLERKEQRDLYIAQNYDQLKKDIAQAEGSHLETLFWFNLCEEGSQAEFRQALQKSFHQLYRQGEPASQFSARVDAVLGESAKLKTQCYQLSAN